MLNIFGVMISFVGSIVLAFSISKNPGAAYQTVKGKRKYLTVINLELFRIGIIILALGFLFQIVSFFNF